MANTENKSTQQYKYLNQSPWGYRIDTRYNPGNTWNVEADFPIPEGIGDEFYHVDPNSSIEIEARFDEVDNDLVLSGTIIATMEGECARCLEPIHRITRIPVNAFFSAHNGNGHNQNKHNQEVEIIADEDEEEETIYPLSSDCQYADFEPLLRDSITTAIPTQPLCSEDCLGLCSQCGINLNEHPDHSEETTDIRWAGLEDLKRQLEQHT